MLFKKTPTNINGNNLTTWLETATEIRMADLYTITLKSGTILRYTTWESSLTVLGNVFVSGPPSFERTAIEEKLGMDVSSIEAMIKANLSDVLSGAPVLQAIGQGLWDGAGFRIDRLFMDSAGNQIGTLIRFSGVVGPVDELTRAYLGDGVDSSFPVTGNLGFNATTPPSGWQRIYGYFTVPATSSGRKPAFLALACYVEIDNSTGSTISTSGNIEAGFDDMFLFPQWLPTGDEIAKYGSMSVTYSGALSYTSNTSSITWSWNINANRTDLPMSVNNYTSSQTITGLSAGTSYPIPRNSGAVWGPRSPTSGSG